MTVGFVCLIVALILFVLAGIGVGGPVNLTAAGLAFVTLSLLLGGVVLR